MRAAVLTRLAALEERVREAVALRRTSDPQPDDPMRGLYLTDAHVVRLMDDGEAFSFPVDETEPVPPGLEGLAARAGLDAVDVELLVVAAAPDIDPRFEKLYGYLHDDVTRRRATIGLALKLAGGDITGAADRRRLGPSGPLVERGFVIVEEPERPFLTRALRVPDRVIGALLGDRHLDPTLRAVAVGVNAVASPMAERLADAFRAGVPLVYLRERAGGTGRHLAEAALTALGRPVVGIDLDGVGEADAASIAAAARREAVLVDGALVAGPVDAFARLHPVAMRTLAGAVPAVLIGAGQWEPAWSSVVPLVLEPPTLSGDERRQLWQQALAGVDGAAVDPEAATAAFRLGPEHILGAAEGARLRALFAGRAVTADDVHAGARSQNSSGLERLARRIEPWASWENLVVTDDTRGLLYELSARVLHRERVLDGWGLRRGGGRGEGITALFAGPSGTGKTLAAEVIAHDLGLDLYTVDLATVVDKYIGETEKNLDRIFTEAERVNAVLFFDEADALFGKRSEVRDARDRYANVEVAYLLQRMERFDGLAVLATNLRANLDDAFARRLDVVVDFPSPDADQRLALWRYSLRPEVPADGDLDLEFCAKAFELSGGHIRNAVVTAAFLAASDGQERGGQRVTMTHVVRGVQREYRKLGRLCLAAEFGPYFDLL